MSQALNMDYYEVIKHEGPVESGHLELDWIWAPGAGPDDVSDDVLHS